MKKLDVVVVGELNVDLILNQIGSFPTIGKETIAKEMTLTLGSSSAIFASNLSSLGARVGFIGMLGKDSFGDLVMGKLEDAGVDTSMVMQSQSVQTGATIVLNFGEDRAMVTHMGAMEQLYLKDVQVNWLRQARHLHLSSIFLQPGIQKDLVHLFKMAKEEGLTTSLDAQWDPEEKWDLNLKELLPYLDLFLPNGKELLKLTGKENLDDAISTLKESETITVIKMGNKGSITIHKNKQIHLPAFLNKNIVDAIGAGDSFNAGFIAKFLQKKPLESCQEFGNLIGAISTTASGGTGAFKTPDIIKEIAKEKFGYEKDEFTN
jgi:sugar/nucleoside kinase (ribokinase family)